MYTVKNNVAQINGSDGIYNNKITNPDVRYGRNAFDNYKIYIQDLSDTDKKVPLKFEYRYMPDGKFNKFALLGNAYEELGKKTKVKTEEMNQKLEKQGFSNLSANALDINQDGYIDVGEYATSTLAQDAISSTQGFNIDTSNIDGLITEDGDKALALNNKNKESEAREIYSKLHQEFKLDKAQEEFLADQNNLE